MNVLDKILDAVRPAAPAKGKDPAEVAAEKIVELALDDVKTGLGSDGLKTWTDGWAKIEKLHHQRNFELTEVTALQLHRQQVSEHAKLAAEGGSLSDDVERGRGKEGWIADLESRRDALELAVQEVAARIKPAHQKVTAILVDRLHVECAELSLAESRLASKYGIVWKPSPTYQTLKSLLPYMAGRGADIACKMLS